MTQSRPLLPTRYAFNDVETDRRWIDAYWESGYVILSGVFATDEIAVVQKRYDRWYAEGMRHPSTFRHQNKVMWLAEDDSIGKIVRGMQWPSYEDEVLDAVRTDPRMLAMLEPLIGGDLKQIINQLHWKTPGALVTWGLHRDVRSRKPADAFRNVGTSYVQTGLAVDWHRAGNGAMQILPGSHRMGKDGMDDFSPRDRNATAEEDWEKAGFDMANLIDVEMEEGDVALWTPYTIHGGGINTTTDNARRLYINGYVAAADCDRGEWVFRDGQPVQLDLANPALIQFDEVREKTHAFYPDRNDLTAKVSD